MQGVQRNHSGFQRSFIAYRLESAGSGEEEIEVKEVNKRIKNLQSGAINNVSPLFCARVRF